MTEDEATLAAIREFVKAERAAAHNHGGRTTCVCGTALFAFDWLLHRVADLEEQLADLRGSHDEYCGFGADDI